MTWEASRHLHPVKTLVVVRDPPDYIDEGRFPDARWTRELSPGVLPDDELRWLLTGVDVLYLCETPYDFRLLDMARAAGVATAVHGMWEFLAWRRDPDLPRPDLFLAPSPWHLAEWPEPTELLPVPVASDRFAEPRPWPERPVVVHAGGAPARGDRNGTEALLRALRFVSVPMALLLRSQAAQRLPVLPRGHPVTVCPQPPTRDYWQVHEGADAAILPRRYGGLSLPLQEATGAGLPIVALDREAEAGYGHAAVVPTTGSRPLRMGAGLVIERHDVSPRVLARTIDRTLGDPAIVEAMGKASRAAAQALSWDALAPRYAEVLGSLAR